MADLSKYPSSKCNTFRIKDTIGVPHPYCIGPQHVGWAADHFSGILSKAAIEDAEKKGVARCEICKGKLSFAEHEQALLVECFKEPKKGTPEGDELNEYLKSIVDQATKDGFAGFVFLKAWR
jgi:hypothetical protein